MKGGTKTTSNTDSKDEEYQPQMGYYRSKYPDGHLIRRLGTKSEPYIKNKKKTKISRTTQRQRQDEDRYNDENILVHVSLWSFSACRSDA